MRSAGPPVRCDGLPRPPAIAILSALLIGVAGSISTEFAVLGLNAGYVRMSEREVDGAQLLGYGIAYLSFAVFWISAAMGISQLREWGWWTAVLTSLAAVAHGAYHLSQSPPLGLTQTYAWWPATGVWFTTIAGGLALAGMIGLFRTFAVLMRPTVRSPLVRRS